MLSQLVTFNTCSRVITDAQAIGPVGLAISQASVARAMQVKNAHVEDLMTQAGIQGVGVGISRDNPDEAAAVI